MTNLSDCTMALFSEFYLDSWKKCQNLKMILYSNFIFVTLLCFIQKSLMTEDDGNITSTVSNFLNFFFLHISHFLCNRSSKCLCLPAWIGSINWARHKSFKGMMRKSRDMSQTKLKNKLGLSSAKLSRTKFSWCEVIFEVV